MKPEEGGGRTEVYVLPDGDSLGGCILYAGIILILLLLTMGWIGRSL